MYWVAIKGKTGNIIGYYYGNRRTGFAYQSAPEIFKDFAIVGCKTEKCGRDGIVDVYRTRQCTVVAKTYESKSVAKGMATKLKNSYWHYDAVAIEVTPEMFDKVAEMVRQYPE